VSVLALATFGSVTQIGLILFLSITQGSQGKYDYCHKFENDYILLNEIRQSFLFATKLFYLMKQRHDILVNVSINVTALISILIFILKHRK